MKHTSLDGLIAAAKQHDRPPTATSSRAWASLESAIAAGVGPSVPVTAATASATATGGLGIKGLIVVGVAVVMGAAGAIAVSSEQDPPVAKQERRGASTPVEAVEVPSIAAAPEVAPAPFAEVQPVVVEVEATPSDTKTEARRVDRRPVAAPRDDPGKQSDLAEQARLLGEAWRELNAGQTARALTLVQEHARRFPNSPLAPEREACRIVAWCGEGRPWAKQKATAFLAAHGGTPASRVRQACAEEKE